MASCSDARKARLEGAQRALAALPDIEVVSSDAATGRLTVRSRRTGATTTVDLESASATAPRLAAQSATTRTADRDPNAGGIGSPAVQPPAVPGSGEPDATLAAGTAATPLDPAGAPGGATADSTAAAAGATVVRDPQGRVSKIEGSGFSIERSAASARATTPLVTAAATPAPLAKDRLAERRRISVPFVCGAGESRALQGVDLDVPGAGIVAERGCTLTVANVRVRAGGWGLVVNPGATVRIDDSLVEGRTGALDLYPGGSLSAWATTFRGALGRPVATPQFVDRGGNAWD